MARTASRLRRGVTLVETLIASLIVTITLFGAVALFGAAYTQNNLTAEDSIAAAIAKREIEEAKNLGFLNLPEGETTSYFDAYGEGGGTTKLATSVYAATLDVDSTALSGSAPTTAALRVVTVTVKRASDNAVLETTGTYLAWGGP
jgi:Tfp pilus assembly protein PilV